jgi:hypothetical protein
MRTHIVTIAEVAHQYVQCKGMKPDGFWYAFDDEWFNWVTNCTEERFENLARCYEVVIDPDLDILLLDTTEKIEEFTERFVFHHRIFSEVDATVNDVLCGMFIDWPKVASCHQGIELNPYPRRWMLDVISSPIGQRLARWHISWDCASGCIWARDGYVLIERPDLLEKWRRDATAPR